jgi:hypothetical protein
MANNSLALTGVTAIALGLIVTACASLEEQAADAPASTSPWNEIPLAPGVFREQGRDYRSDVIDIPLEAFGELEYKLGMNAGDSIVYKWDALETASPQLLYAEFHGHTERVGDAPGDLMFYRKASGGSERGALTAPFTGIHGWYLKNDTDRAMVVRLNVAGFYELLAQ